MKSAILPIFPLSLVVFPDEFVNLHIFEPRYKQLIVESEANNLTFGIPTYIENHQLSWGTEVALKEIVEKYPDGKIDIKIQGKRIFKVENYIPRMSGRLYSGADIILMEPDLTVDYQKNAIILTLMTELFQYLKLHKPLPVDAYSFNSYQIAHFIGLPITDELKILSLLKETERQDFIINHLRNIIPVMKEINALESKIKLNGHFRSIIPPNL